MTAVRQRLVKLTPRQEREAYTIATARDSDTCQKCLRDCGPTARDHRQNRDPYNTVASNLQILGLKCHQWKTENPERAIAAGWAVPKFTPLGPCEWPARRQLRSSVGTVRAAWVLYDDEGGFKEITEVEAQRLRAKGGLN